MRKTLRVTLLVGLLLSINLALPEDNVKASFAQTQRRPNIVFVLTDDQSPGTESAMPALNNNVTSEGVQFTNMISTSPLCCPSRATILRGQYPQNTRIYGNSLPRGGWQKFRERGEHTSTVATWLNDAGYRTGLFGKYMNGYTDPDIPPGWDRWYAWNGPRQGWHALNDQGVQKPLEPQEADSQSSEAALRFLGNHVGRSAPVFAFVNFGAAHEPYYYDQADADTLEGLGVPRGPSFNEADVSDKPPQISALPALSESDVARIDQNYANGLRSLMRVDRFVGRASDMLRSKGEMDNTYFVFYTDNGSHFGQHRLPEGKLEPYEEDINFPLIVRGPGIPRGVSSGKLVGNHDIAPTLAQIGGARVPAFVDGRSFLPIMQDPSVAWPRTAILSERATNTDPTKTWQMLRMRGKVYTRFDSGEKEYYDLRTDPYQLHNAFGTADRRYPPPAQETRGYYAKRLGDIYDCSGHEGTVSCSEAEDAPLLP
jgi:N-acetylglucosamine-6-sulfatase